MQKKLISNVLLGLAITAAAQATDVRPALMPEFAYQPTVNKRIRHRQNRNAKLRAERYGPAKTKTHCQRNKKGRP